MMTSSPNSVAAEIQPVSLGKPLRIVNLELSHCVGLATTGPCVCAAGESSLWICDIRDVFRTTITEKSGYCATGMVALREGQDDTLVITSRSYLNESELRFIAINTNTLYCAYKYVLNGSLSFIPIYVTAKGGKLIMVKGGGDIVICKQDGRIKVEKIIALKRDITCVVAVYDGQYAVLARISGAQFGLYWIGPDQKVTHIYGESPGQNLKEPSHMVLDERRGNLLVADTDNNRVLLFGPDRKLQQVIQLSDRNNELSGPKRLCIDEVNGHLFVSHDSRNSKRCAELHFHKWPLELKSPPEATELETSPSV